MDSRPEASLAVPTIGAPCIREDIRRRIHALPRTQLACLPTPMQEARRLSEFLGGPRIFIKRDDLTGVAFGGNKTRNLEFRLAAAQQIGADLLVVELDQQSNSARQTAGCANRLGIETVLILEGMPPDEIQGNLLVDHLLGADIRFAADPDEQRRLSDAAIAEAAERGRNPCLLNELPMFDEASAIAYIENALEIEDTLAIEGLRPDYLYMSSSGKGQAGHVLAKRLFDASFESRGVTATDKFDVPPRAAAIANRAAARLQVDVEISSEAVTNDQGFVGAGYGLPTEAGIEAVRIFARTEGVILDPVYSGKCAAGMIAHIRRGDFGSEDVVVFVHTGGTPAIFTHNELWTR